MTKAMQWRRVRRITWYVLLMFIGFVIIWLVLLAKVRSAGPNYPQLVTEVEVHSLQVRWGIDVLAVPIIAAAIIVARHRRNEFGDIAIALLVGLSAAVGMAYLPSAVMGGHIPWPLRTTHFDASGYVDSALVYAAVIVVICIVVNRIAASVSSPAALDDELA